MPAGILFGSAWEPGSMAKSSLHAEQTSGLASAPHLGGIPNKLAHRNHTHLAAA